MTLHPSRLLRAARAVWRRDRSILTPLAGLFLFVPQWALLLLVPALPTIGEGSSPEATLAAFSAWISAHAGLYVLAGLASQFGMLAVAALYVGEGAGRTGSALARAVRAFPRFLLALLLVWLPVALGGTVLLSATGPAAAFAVMPLLYVLAVALLMLVAPAVAAGEPAARAIGRALAVSRGSRLPLAGLAAGLSITGQVVAALPVALAHQLQVTGRENPLVVALLDAGAAGALAAASLMVALIGAIAYRVLGSAPR